MILLKDQINIIYFLFNKNNFIKKNPSFAKKKICNMSINLNNDLFTGLNYVEVQICATNNSVIKDIELFSKEEY